MRKSVLLTPLAVALLVLGAVVPAQAESFRAFGVQAIASPDRPSGVTINPLTNMVYTVNPGDGSTIGHGGSVTVINGNTNTVVGSPIPVGSSPYAIVANPTNNSVYVSDSVDGTVTVISGDIPKVTQVISLNDYNVVNAGGDRADVSVGAYGIAVDPVTNKVFVTTMASIHAPIAVQISSFRSILGSTNTLLPRTDLVSPLGTHPDGVAVNPARGLVYVAAPAAGVVEVWDESKLEKVGEIPALHGARTLGVNYRTNEVYIPDSDGSTVTVVDGATNMVQRVINVGSHPFGVGVNELTNTIYVPNSRDDSVAVIDGVKNDITGTPINVGASPVGVAVNSSRKALYVANQGDSTVSSISERSTPDITSGSPTPGAVGFFYSFVVTVVGSPAPALAVTSGVLPPGLTMNGSTGVISGRPTMSGSFRFTVTAHNATNFDQKKTYTLVVTP